MVVDHFAAAASALDLLINVNVKKTGHAPGAVSWQVLSFQLSNTNTTLDGAKLNVVATFTDLGSNLAARCSCGQWMQFRPTLQDLEPERPSFLHLSSCRSVRSSLRLRNMDSAHETCQTPRVFSYASPPNHILCIRRPDRITNEEVLQRAASVLDASDCSACNVYCLDMSVRSSSSSMRQPTLWQAKT